MLEIGAAPLEAIHDEGMRRLRLDLQPPAIQAQKNIGGKKSDSLVAIHEGVIHQQGLEQRRRHLGDVPVVAGTGSIESALQKSNVAHARRAAKTPDEALVHQERLVQREEPDQGPDH